jgi:GNAT superfamily N-acetyltransferase
MDPQLCARHLEDLDASGQRAWVAEETETGRLVGELETLTGPDPDETRVATIDVLVVAADRRRAGAGRALVERAVRAAGADGAHRVLAVSEPGAVGFYARLGFEPQSFRLRDAELSVGERGPEDALAFRPAPFPRSFEALAGRRLVLGGFPSSFAVWWKRRWPVPGLTDGPAAEEAEVDRLDAHYRLERSPFDPGAVNAVGWAGSREATVPLLGHVAARARARGFARLGTMVRSDDPAIPEELGVRTEAEFPTLARRPG